MPFPIIQNIPKSFNIRKHYHPDMVLNNCSCKVDAVVTLDARGQIVLPKDIREKANLDTGDKLAVISCEDGERICCITLMKAGDLEESVRKTLGPMLKEMFA